MAYFGEVIKMCANISYLMMTLNRYLLIGNDHAEWLVTVGKLDFKWVIRGSLLFSALINIGHGWEYQAVEDNALTNLDSPLYAISNDYSYSDYPFANQDLPYFIYLILYFIINFGFFFRSKHDHRGQDCLPHAKGIEREEGETACNECL
jgi:hypothetical protein